jgi:hypothetical protein
VPGEKVMFELSNSPVVVEVPKKEIVIEVKLAM